MAEAPEEKHGQTAINPKAMCLCGAVPHPACPRHSRIYNSGRRKPAASQEGEDRG